MYLPSPPSAPLKVMNVSSPATLHSMVGSHSPPNEEKRIAIVICKETRWKFEARRLSKTKKPLTDEELEQTLLAKNIDPRPLKLKEEEQRKVEDAIVDQLREGGLSVRVQSLSSLPSSLPPLPPRSIVVTAGGDGTFLAAASKVFDGTPVVGINSDPLGSEGHLCVGGKNRPADLIRKIVDEKTQWVTRSRIKVTVHGGKKEYTEPLLALNEVFVGEKDSAKVSYYDISIDGSDSQRQKSSGFIASSASGSSAWYSSLNRVLPDTVSDVMEALKRMGIALPPNEELADQVAQQLNDSLVKEPTNEDLLFSVREPIFNKTFAPSPCKGTARRISLRSRCSNANLVLDGSRHIPFDYGTVVTLEIDPDFALRTLL